MFNLDREVASWSDAVNAERCQPSAGAAELSDHLYCEIERRRQEGLTDEAAFHAAVARLGTAGDLSSEHVKNRSAIGVACRFLGHQQGKSRSRLLRLEVAHAVIWATLFIVTASVLKMTAVPGVSAWLLTAIFIPLWLASQQIVQAAARARTGGRG